MDFGALAFVKIFPFRAEECICPSHEIIPCDISRYIGIAHQQNNRGAGDLIKLSVFRQHVIEMQLLERQYTTNVHAHLCARRNMFSTAAREKISLKHAASFEQNNY